MVLTIVILQLEWRMEAAGQRSGEEGFVIKHNHKNNKYKGLTGDSRILHKCFRDCLRMLNERLGFLG